MMDYEQLVAAYEVDVGFPEVSGMEHLEMLCNRSALAREETSLTANQRTRLAAADQLLLQQVRPFYQAIQRVANLEVWRRQQSPPPTHWWWYLDVLAQLPDALPQRTPGLAVPA